jgi:hypothetical protein
MGAKKKTTKKKVKPSLDERELELSRLLTEHSVLKDRRDAIDEMIDVRKERILMLMSESGMGRYKSANGEASFTCRRSFRVHDRDRLAELMSPKQLASLVRITADVYDAADREGVPLDEAVTVGQSESLTISRARTKDAQELRKKYIEESKRQAEQRIQAAVLLLQDA